MKLSLVVIFALSATKFVNCQNPVNYQNPDECVISCNEKFTENTNRTYSNYTGCLIEKRHEPADC